MTRPLRAKHLKQDSPYLTTNEAVDYLKVYDVSAVYRLMREYRLPYVRCGGRLRFDTRELDQWMRDSAMRPDLDKPVRRKPAKATTTPVEAPRLVRAK